MWKGTRVSWSFIINFYGFHDKLHDETSKENKIKIMTLIIILKTENLFTKYKQNVLFW